MNGDSILALCCKESSGGGLDSEVLTVDLSSLNSVLKRGKYTTVKFSIKKEEFGDWPVVWYSGGAFA